MKKLKRSHKPTVRKHSPVEKIEKKSSGPNKLIIFSIALLSLVALLLVKNIFGSNPENLRKKTIPEAVKKILGDTKTEVTISKLRSMSGIYEFDLGIGTGTQARKYVSYITKDAKILFTTGIKIADIGKTTASNQPAQKKLTCADLNKSETPKLTGFVVSNCPYGLQMQRVFKKAIAEQPELANALDIKYIGAVENGKITAMHGDAEAQENLKQICIREEQKEKYWPYVSCYMEAGKSEDCSATAGIDTESVEACKTDAARGLAYAQKDFDIANKFNIGSSPTLLLNDNQIVSEFDFGGRVADSIQQVVCCGSKEKAGYCETKLTTDEVAVAFSTTDAPAAGGSAPAANCN